MKIFEISWLLVFSIALTASMCSTEKDADKASVRINLKIALSDSLATQDDEERHLPENVRKLCDVIASENKDCNRIYILDPVLLRLDLGKEVSLKTSIEKGGSKDISNPKVISRLIKKNLDEISVPKEFTKSSTSKEKGQLVGNFILNKVSKDSILVLSTDGSLDSYDANGRKHKVFRSVEDIRDEMTRILCEKEKTTFTLLIDPPVSTRMHTEKGVEVEPPTPPTVVTTDKVKKNSVSRGRVKNPVTRQDNGDLTIIKGSEGCEICTRYYSATDNLGRTRQVTQKNSTECCPCGKTIEMRGRTYRMECDGSSNRLSLVE